MKKNWPDHRRAVMAGAFVTAMWAVTPPAEALTLGKAVIQSAIGESMRAEVEFESLSAEEAESLRANIASAETYRLSGVDYNASLSGARVVLQRLANRKPSLRITSDRSIQEPFVELILEINWRGGRLVRSYTLLFDLPQTTRNVTTPAAISGNAAVAPFAPAAVPPPFAPPAAPTMAPPVRPERSRAVPPPVSRRGPPPLGSPPAPPLIDDPYRVRPGDTLSELAQRGTRPAGISLDRLVVAMYRENPTAFFAGNMNRLRNGAVLAAPSQRAIDAVSDAEARQVIRAQSSDFNGYRGQLAAMPTERPETNTRRATGKIQAAVEDRKQAAAPTPDKLTLSKPSAATTAEVDKASKERERQDAATRIAELSKNVQDLGRLSGTASAPTAPVAAPPAITPPAASAAGGLPVTGLPSPTLPAVPATSSPTQTPAPPSLASAPMAPVAPPASAPRPRPRMKPPEPPPETGLMDTLMQDNLPAVGLAGALLALLAGFGVYRLVKRKRAAAPETSFLESRLKPDSFFGASGGQRIDTREAAATGASSSMMNYSLSQLDAIGDVDPVAEADVYLAYGRDLQAEEILKEAMRTTPERLAIRTKLLEVYAKRRDGKGFEQLALQLHSLTGGAGEDWDKAREMGHTLDPENPLYGGAGQRVDSGLPDHEPEIPSVGVPTMPLPQPPSVRHRDDLPTQPAPNSTFDLDLDLDLGMDELPQNTVPVATHTAPAAPMPPPAPVAYAPKPEDMVTFVTPTGFGDLSPGAPPPPAAPPPKRAAPESVPFNASAFSLDLDLPEPSGVSAGPSMLPPLEGFDAPPKHGAAAAGHSAELDIDAGDPLARKLELADEFRQIGDLEGARDLLQEVIDRADGALKVKAQSMLASLS